MKTRERRKREKRKKSRKGFITFLIAAFALCVAVNVFLSRNSRLETMMVRTGTEEEVIAAEGYIFKEQTVITAPSDGFVYCEADEEQRVKIGETVMYIYKNEVNAAASNELKAVEEEIEKLSGSSLKGDVFSNDSAKIEQNILLQLKAVPLLGYENDIEAVSQIKNNVNSLIEDRRVITGEVEAKDSLKELETLKSKKAELEKKYNIERTEIVAPKAGAFTSRVDGMEELLTPDALNEISLDTIKKIEKQFKKGASPSKAKSGDAIGKIVDNFNWSIAAALSKDFAEDIDVGDNIEMRFTDVSVETVTGTVSKITAEEKGKVILVVNSNKYINNIYSSSKANVEFIKHNYEGFKIPSESIRIVDGKTGVYVIRNDKARFIPVDILYNSKEWVIVSETGALGQTTIKLYDELIVSGKELYDNKVVR